MMIPRFLLMALAIALPGSLGAQQLSAGVAKDFAEYRIFSPQQAFAVSPDGRIDKWSATNPGNDPGSAVGKALARCQEQAKTECRLYAVNNILLDGRDWKTAAPASLPAIGRLRPQPWWHNKGPQEATGLLVWSHGYLAGVDNTNSAPYPFIGRFLAAGYDLYRFDRQWIHDQPGDATDFANSVRQAKAMGYRRVILAGQSNGAFQSLAAVQHGAPADGVISTAAALNDDVTKLRDVSIPRDEFRQMVRAIKPGPRLVVVNFPEDAKDVGGRMDDARAAFGASGADAIILEPADFKGHNAANTPSFTRKFSACIHAFIETGQRQAPCS
jgi:hypothetical protein